MPKINYQQGKIYCIYSDKTDEIYIGMTCYELLSKRLARHRFNHKNKPYIGILDYPDNQIELLEEYPCNNRGELKDRYQEWIITLSCINELLSIRCPNL